MVVDSGSSSQSSLWQIALVYGLSAVISTIIMGFFWKMQPLLAAMAVAFYAIGGARGFPWRTSIRKAFSVGVFIGIVISSAMFYWKLL